MPIVSIFTRRRAYALAAVVAFLATHTVAPARTQAAGESTVAVDPFATGAARAIVAYAPDDAASLISVRCDALVANASFAELQRRSAWLASFVERVERESGGPLADVARATQYNRAGEQPLFALHFRTPVSLEHRLASRLAGEAYRRESIDGATLYAPEGRAAAWRTAFAQADDRTILAGPAGVLAEVLARRRPAILATSFSAAAARLDYAQPFVAAVDFEPFAATDGDVSSAPFGSPWALARTFGAIALEGAISDDAAFAARLVCRDRDVAIDVGRSLTFGRDLARFAATWGVEDATLVERVSIDRDADAVVVRGGMARDRFWRLLGEPRTDPAAIAVRDF